MRVTQPRRREFGSGSDESKRAKLRHALHYGREQLERGRVDPVDIFENDENRLPCCQPIELTDHAAKVFSLRFCGIRSCIGSDPRPAAPRRWARTATCSGPLCIRGSSVELGQVLHRRVVAFEPGSPFELVNEWEQSTVRMMCRAEIAQRDMGFTLQSLVERAAQCATCRYPAPL